MILEVIRTILEPMSRTNAMLGELNQPLKLACKWKMRETRAVDLDVHCLGVRHAHPQILE